MFSSKLGVLDSEEKVFDWLAEIEESCGVSPVIGNSEICKEVEKSYVEVVCNGLGFMVSGDQLLVASREKSPEVAWMRWAEAFLSYQRPRGGKIHWRHRPEMTHVEKQAESYPHQEVGYCVYSRLFVEVA